MYRRIGETCLDPHASFGCDYLCAGYDDAENKVKFMLYKAKIHQPIILSAALLADEEGNIITEADYWKEKALALSAELQGAPAR